MTAWRRFFVDGLLIRDAVLGDVRLHVVFFRHTMMSQRAMMLLPSYGQHTESGVDSSLFNHVVFIQFKNVEGLLAHQQLVGRVAGGLLIKGLVVQIPAPTVSMLKCL